MIGSGTMGNGIAQVFAQAGHEVRLIDAQAPALERALKTISGSLDRLVKKEALSPQAREAALGRIRTATAVSEAREADWVVEAA